MPSAKASLRAEQQSARDRMRALGLSYREIAAEFARRYGMRPRAAWRHAYGWTLRQAAEHINMHTGQIGLDPGGISAMTASHLCEYEAWPGNAASWPVSAPRKTARKPEGRRPTPYLLALLASVYDCTVHDLLDWADYEYLTAADRLILDTYGKSGSQSDDPHAPGHIPTSWSAAAPAREHQHLTRTAAHTAPPGHVFTLPARDPGILGPDDEERLILAVERPSRLDERVVGSLSAVLAAQRELEDRIGSSPMLAPVAAQVAQAEDLISDSPPALRSRVLDIAAQYCYFHGWLQESTGQLRHASLLYDRALGQAVEAGNANLISELLSMKGHIAWAAGNPAETIRLSQAAQRDNNAFPGQHAISAMQEARAHAVLGDARSATRKLDDGDRLAREAARQNDDQPPWLYYHSAGFFTIQRGRTWMHLGAHDQRYTARAIEELTAGIAALDGTARQSEWGASYLLHVARAHMQNGDADQACAAAADATAIAHRMASATLLARLRKLHARMAERWPGVPAITELGECLR